MTSNSEETIKKAIFDLLSSEVKPSETRDNLLEKLIRRFIRKDVHRISEFEPHMHESLKKRFQFELDGIKFNLL